MPFERQRWYGLKLSYSVAGAIYAALATESQCCRFSQGYTAWKPETVSVGCQLHRSTSKASGDFQRLVRITSQSCFECQDDCQHCSWMLKAIYLTGALGDNDRFFCIVTMTGWLTPRCKCASILAYISDGISCGYKYPNEDINSTVDFD